LRMRLVAVGSELVVDALVNGVSGLPVPQPQDGEVTMAEKITTDDLHIQWGRTAREVTRVVRLGRAWTTFRGRRLGVLDAGVGPGDAVPAASAPGTLHGANVSTGEGSLVLRRVQPESRSPMSADEWLRGIRPQDGERLGTD
jgi:methionyl-tRNA formyltransferase